MGPALLPDIENLRRLTKSIAMLDANICPKWGQGEEMASMRNGCGDDWFLLFDSHGAALKGVAHEIMSARLTLMLYAQFTDFIH